MLVVVIAVTVIVVVAVRFASAALFTAALAMPAFDAWVARWSPVPAREEISLASSTPADLYRPRHPRAAVLLVHGLSPAGRRHPELVRLARLFARHGYLVMVPQFEGLASFHLSGHEVEETRKAITRLRAENHTIAVAGFSFGAGPALLAAADESGLGWIGSFGGYADLRNVIVFLTTGVHQFGSERYRGHVEEYNRWKLLALLAPLVDDADDRETLRRIASRRLANPFDDVHALAADLGPAGRAVMELSESRREEQTRRLLAHLSPATRDALDRLSPVTVASRLHGRLWLVHGAADDSIPFTESLRLAAASGAGARAIILDSFHHTGPQAPWRMLLRRASDARALFLLVDAILHEPRAARDASSVATRP